MKLVHFNDDYFNYDHISVVRQAGRDQSIIFTSGQSAIDGGFLIDMSIEDVLDVLEDARVARIAQELNRSSADDDEPVNETG